MYAPAMVTLTPSNELYIAEQGNFRVRSMGAGHPKVGEVDNYLIPGPDPNDIFIFNGQGQHLRTFNMKTRRDVHKFEYNEDGLLQKVTDWKNNSVQVERLSDGIPHAIVSPKGVRTVLGVNAEGLMDFFSDPSDGITRVSYQDGGLIRGVNYPDGFSHYLAYDENGRVFAQYDNLGRRELYGNFQGSTSSTVTTYTSLNREQSVETQSSSSQIKKIYKTKAGKTHEVISKVQEGITETTFPDGTMTIESGAPHPVWGSQVSLPGTSITVLPSGLQKRIDNDHFATLDVPDDPLTLQTIGQHVKVNDQTISTTEYSYSDRASTLTVDGNIRERIIYDDMDRPVRIQRPSTGFVDTTLEYVDSSEEVKRMKQGEMWLDYTYDNHGNIISERTKSGLETRFEYFQNGKLSKLILPSGRTYQFLYDGASNFFKIIMPSGAEHRMQTRIRTETRDELYKAPVSQQTIYLSTYNLDSDLIRTYHFVLGCVFHWYDDFDRLTAAAFDKHFIRFAYIDNSNNVVNVNRYYEKNKHSIIEYSYDGFLPTQQIVSDGSEVSATYVYEYNNVFLINQIRATVYGRRYETAMEYDDFGVMTKYGQFDLSYISPNTRRISDSNVECTYTHDQNGRITDIICMINSNEVFSYRLSYNGESLVSGRAVKIAQDDYTNQYLYDDDGQLVDVSTDGQASEHYEYDINGNRVSWGGVGGREQHSALYDDNDRIQQFDSLLCKFTDDGFLLRKGSAIFAYNAKGELEKASDNGFYVKEYRYDALGRLIESSDSSNDDRIRYFYGDPGNVIRVTHVVYGEEELVTALYYNQLGHLFAMVTEDVISYVMCDHLGTPMAVFDEQGRLIKMIIRDSYGVLLSDSAPGVFVPIGYVGGIFDAKTTLTRFHYRDYDASIGRWTSRDPSLYSSQQPNLYQYVFNDPINLRDPLGLFCIGGTSYNIIGGGAELCFDRNGWSACVEAGLGVGGPSFGIDSGAPKKGFTSEIFADVSVSVPGYSIGGRTALKFQPDKRPCVETTTFQEVQFGRGKLKQGSEGTYQAQMDLTSSRKQRKKKKFGVGAKAGVKACYGR
ncbi:teneurin-2-like [Ptychodera flava]|uniref:teneurin-2-like n=1 Tax=Ptychodera flava TaxID=63121 RepID=UPI003969CE73